MRGKHVLGIFILRGEVYGVDFETATLFFQRRVRQLRHVRGGERHTIPPFGISLLIQGLQIPAYIGKQQAGYGLAVHAFADIVVLATAVAKYASQLWP